MIIIIGLGSMGKRRIRCLQALGYSDIVGFDTREDRRNEAKEKYGIETTQDIMVNANDIVFICCPPKHHKYYSDAVSANKTFIEAGTELLEHGTPSATMLFNPLIQDVKNNLIEIGKIINITYHCGQYLPDWHRYEKVSDFYVGEVGATEMVAFELMWFTKLFGYQNSWSSITRRGKEIEGLDAIDSVAIQCEDDDSVTTMMIDVVSRDPIRKLVVNGEKKQLNYNLNPGISENMYINEVKAFMDGNYPNTLEHSNKVIQLTKQLCA